MGVRIHSFGSFVPRTFVSSTELENILRSKNPSLKIPSGILETMTGITRRPIADDNDQASDLAVRAAESSITKYGGRLEDIDLLIFASASQDVSEPATANIVQTKLGLMCPAFDVKNACNSVMSAIEIATAFVNAGMHKNILIASGEIPSRVVRHTFDDRDDFKQSFPSLTLGDAGGSLLVSYDEQSNVHYQKSYTYGEHWKLAAFIEGGSMQASTSDGIKFVGDGTALKNAFLSLGDSIVREALSSVGWDMDDIDQLFIHQVAAGFTAETLQLIGVPADKTYATVEKQGNLASASLPIAITQALDDGTVRVGDKVMVIGLASGINVSVLLLTI